MVTTKTCVCACVRVREMLMIIISIIKKEVSCDLIAQRSAVILNFTGTGSIKRKQEAEKK